MLEGSAKLRNLLCGVSLAAAMTFAAVPASAAPLSGAGSIPGGGTNDLLGPLGLDNPLFGWFGQSLYVSADTTVQIEYLGFEAGWTNKFLWENAIIATTGDATGNKGTQTPSEGLLPFKFTTNKGTGDPNAGSAVNGVSNDYAEQGSPNFFISFGNGTDNIVDVPVSDIVYLFFDDGGGTNDDDNHDDFAIKLTFSSGPDGSVFCVGSACQTGGPESEVPLPAAAWLFLSVVGGYFGLSSVKRKKKSALATA